MLFENLKYPNPQTIHLMFTCQEHNKKEIFENSFFYWKKTTQYGKVTVGSELQTSPVLMWYTLMWYTSVCSSYCLLFKSKYSHFGLKWPIFPGIWIMDTPVVSICSPWFCFMPFSYSGVYIRHIKNYKFKKYIFET